MIERARELTEIPVLFGLEWNAPEGRHANLIFPPGPRESEHAYAFARGHDRRLDGSRPEIAAAMARLSGLPATERPILVFNHPVPGDWSADTLDRYLTAGANGVIAGIEVVHGHQAQAVAAGFHPASYPSAAVGGLADHVYVKGRQLSLLANSDFHVHKQHKEYDYPLGVFNHTLVGVRSPEDGPAAILDALRAGRTCAAQGHWLDLVDFSIVASSAPEQCHIADVWNSAAGDAVLSIGFEAREEIREVDVIGCLAKGSPPSVLRSFGQRPTGRCRLEFEIPAGTRGYVRLRVISADMTRPAPGPRAAKAFLTSAILLNAD